MRDLITGARAFSAIALILGAAAAAGTAGAFASPVAVAAARPDPVLTVSAGGDRTGSVAVAGLAGERFEFFAGVAGAPPEPGATPLASCVTTASGQCSVTVPPRSGGSGGAAQGYWVRQVSVPDGWFASAALTVGADSEEKAVAYSEIFVAKVTADISVPTADTSGSAGYAARGSQWTASRSNPLPPAKCGLKVALLFDLSGSIGSNIIQLRRAGTDFVKALTGTPSQVAVFTFASDGPASRGGNSSLPPTSVATAGSAAAVTAKINGLTVANVTAAKTNWDQGIWQIAADPARFDLTLVLTDGSPTVSGPNAAGSGSGTRFIEMENGIFAANSLKAKGTSVIAVGIGNAAGVTQNLAAISGPVAGQDYYTTGFGALGQLLTELALKNCLGTVNVIEEVIPATSPGDFEAAVPAPGWDFRASPASVSPRHGVTGAEGGISFATQARSTGPVTLTAAVQPGYQPRQAPNGQNAACRRSDGTEVPVTDTAAGPGFTVDARANEVITCGVYHSGLARPDPATLIVRKRWEINGETYADPSQPPDFQAALTLSPVHPAGTAPTWGTEYGGYEAGDQVTIGEQAVRIPAGCTDEVSGDTGSRHLTAGINTKTVIEKVACTTRLTLVKRIYNPYPGAPTVPPDSWTLTAGQVGQAPVTHGTTGITAPIEPGTSYLLAESGVPGYDQYVEPGAHPVPGTSGSWSCVERLPGGRTGREDFGGADGVIKVPAGAHAVCTAVDVAQPARLTLVEHLVQDRGNAVPAGWKLRAQPDPAIVPAAPVVSGHTGTWQVTNVAIPPGVRYRLAESGPAGSQLAGLACVRTGPAGSELTLSAGFTAAIGEVITCTFTNQAHAGPTPSPAHSPTGAPAAAPTWTAGPLPVTGVNLLRLLAIASALTLGGGTALVVARRRS